MALSALPQAPFSFFVRLKLKSFAPRLRELGPQRMRGSALNTVSRSLDHWGSPRYAYRDIHPISRAGEALFSFS